MQRYGFVAIIGFVCAALVMSFALREDESSAFKCKVIGVSDGDTLVLDHPNRKKVRLLGVDCPETKQNFGEQAKLFTQQQCVGKEVTIRPAGSDKYNRTVANVVLPDGKNLGEELVSHGLAWWCERYAPDNQLLAQSQEKACSEKRGLWAESSAVAPWEFRRDCDGSCRTDAMPIAGIVGAITGVFGAVFWSIVGLVKILKLPVMAVLFFFPMRQSARLNQGRIRFELVVLTAIFLCIGALL